MPIDDLEDFIWEPPFAAAEEAPASHAPLKNMAKPAPEISMEILPESQSERVDWDNIDFTADVKRRGVGKEGITVAQFEADVQLFQAQIKTFPKLTFGKVLTETEGWDFSVPSEDCFDAKPVYGAYARLISYRDRLGYLFATAKTYYEVLLTAYESLLDTACDLGSGTVASRKAQANYRVRPLEQAVLQAKAVYNFLVEKSETLKLMTINLSSSLKHLENINGVKRSWNAAGQEENFNRFASSNSEGQNAEIRTIKNRTQSDF